MASERAGPDARRLTILDSAERCFIRRGFHRATMQDVAAEAGMSPGNLYRYFPSKDAIVAGLAERDRAQIAADFSMLSAGPVSFDRFEERAREHFRNEPAEKMIMMVEIWAESTRNPAIAERSASVEQAVAEHLGAYLARLQAAGQAAPEMDVSRAVMLMMMLVDGFFKTRATEAGVDLDKAIDVLFSAFRGVLAGGLGAARPGALKAAE